MTHSQRGLASDMPIRAITGEGVALAEEPDPVATQPEPTSDTSVSIDLGFVMEGELGGVAAGTPIEELNMGQLRTLAKGRGIRLGVRKDKRELTLRALRDGA